MKMRVKKIVSSPKNNWVTNRLNDAGKTRMAMSNHWRNLNEKLNSKKLNKMLRTTVTNQKHTPTLCPC